MDFATAEDELRTLFEAYGAVKTVTALTDRDTGQALGFASVLCRTGNLLRFGVR
jgi:RNA recognition motif-containing protein